MVFLEFFDAKMDIEHEEYFAAFFVAEFCPHARAYGVETSTESADVLVGSVGKIEFSRREKVELFCFVEYRIVHIPQHAVDVFGCGLLRYVGEGQIAHDISRRRV